MSDIDELRGRVEAAKDRLAAVDEAQGRELAELTDALERAEARAAEQDERVRDLEARNLRLTNDNRQLKEMLLALLTAVESRNTDRVRGTVRDMGARLGSLQDAAAERTEETAAEAAGDTATDMLLTEAGEQPAVAGADPSPETAPEAEADRSLPPGIERALFDDGDTDAETGDDDVVLLDVDDDSPAEDETDTAPETAGGTDGQGGFAAHLSLDQHRTGAERPPGKPH